MNNILNYVAIYDIFDISLNDRFSYRLLKYETSLLKPKERVRVEYKLQYCDNYQDFLWEHKYIYIKKEFGNEIINIFRILMNDNSCLPNIDNFINHKFGFNYKLKNKHKLIKLCNNLFKYKNNKLLQYKSIRTFKKEVINIK